MPALTTRLLLCLAALTLAACSSTPKQQTAKVDQSGVLKVHPGLLGKPVPPELQEKDEPRRVATVDATQGSGAPGAAPATPASKRDAATLRSQRSLYFDYADASLKPEHEQVLAAHADYLAQHPKAKVRVEGNADERGSDGFNKRLGQQRADAVKQALTSRGAADKQVRAVSLGEAKPKERGHDESSWAENRRADIIYEQDE